MASILPIDEYSLGADTQINYQDPGPIATGQAPPMAESPLPLGPMGGGGAPPASRQLRELMATPLPQAEVPLNWADKMMSWHPVNQASRAQRQSDAQAGIVKERQRQVGDLKTAWEIEQKQFTAQKEQIAMVSEFVLKHPGATQVERVRAGQAAKKMGVELGLSDATHPIIDAIVRQPSVAQAAAHLMPFIEDVGAFNDALAASGGIAKSGGDVASASYKMASMTVKRRLFERLGEISLAYKDQGKPVDPEGALAQLKRSGDQGPFMHDVFIGNAPSEMALNPEERAYTQEVLGFPDLAGLAKASQVKREKLAELAGQGPALLPKTKERLERSGFNWREMDATNPEHAKIFNLAAETVQAEDVRQAGATTGAQHQAALDVELSPAAIAGKTKLARAQAQAQADVALDQEFRRPLGESAAKWSNVFGERASGSDSIRSATHKGMRPELPDKATAPAAAAKMMQVSLDQLEALAPRLASKGLLAAGVSGFDKLKTLGNRYLVKPGDPDLAAWTMHAGTMVSAMRSLGDIGSRAQAAYNSAMAIIESAQSAAGATEALKQMRTLLAYTAPSTIERKVTAYKADGTAVDVVFEPGDTIADLPEELSLIKPPKAPRESGVQGGTGRRTR